MTKPCPSTRQCRYNVLTMTLFLVAIIFLATFRVLGGREQRSSRVGQAAYHKPGPNLIPDSYFVSFHPNYTLQDHYNYLGRNLSETASGFVDVPGLGGYFAVLDSYTVHEEIRFDPGVNLVEHDERVKPMKVEIEASREGVYTNDASNQGSERRAPWFRTTTLNAGYGSAMISAPNKTDFTSRKGTYDRMNNAGAEVTIYVLDTGVNINHVEFEGRASFLGGASETDLSKYTGLSDNPKIQPSDFPTANTNADKVGHGTHVAGIAAGAGEGAAPKANIISVKSIAENTDHTSRKGLAMAINDVVDDHISKRGKMGHKGSVINLSIVLQAGDHALYLALYRAYQEGITTVVAAGNENTGTENIFPCAWSDLVICVAACDWKYNKWSKAGLEGYFTASNYGPRVAIIAPGAEIWSASNNSNTGQNMLSGTSQATPFVSGIAATIIGNEADTITPTLDLVRIRLMKNNLVGLVTGFYDKDSRLANNGINDPRRLPWDPYYGVYHGTGGLKAAAKFAELPGNSSAAGNVAHANNMANTVPGFQGVTVASVASSAASSAQTPTGPLTTISDNNFYPDTTDPVSTTTIMATTTFKDDGIIVTDMPSFPSPTDTTTASSEIEPPLSYYESTLLSMWSAAPY